MSTHIISCPACHRALRSSKPLPAGAILRCPECKGSFKSPSRPLPFGPWLLIAVTASIILGASGITAALLLSGGRTSPSADAKQEGDEIRARLEAAEKKAKDAEKELAQEKLKQAVARLLDEADAALKAGRHAEAEKLFDKALKMSPTDARAASGVFAAKAALAAAAKTAEADGKREADREKLLADGRAALLAKQYARAVPILEAARALAPADKAILIALAEARAGLVADESQKKTLAEYGKALAAGQLAADGNRFEDAAREFAAALALVPDSPEAKAGLKKAEGKLAGAAALAQKQKAMDRMIDQARAAQARKGFNEAVVTLTAALRLMPGDRDATRMLRAAEATLRKVKASNTRLLGQARQAMANLQLDDAVRLADEAVNAWPEHAAAQKTLKEAQRLRETSRATAVAYARAVQTGAFAMASNLYADAVAAYTEALRLNPGNVDVARELRNARLALERDVRNKTEYERHINRGTLALNQKMWGAAHREFAAAARLLPTDLAAKEGLSRARYGKAMDDGKRALNLKRKAEALAAFDAALAELPGDVAARQGKMLARGLR